MSYLSYWVKLRQLRLQSPERRRERYQIIYTWRIIEGQVPIFDSTPIKVTFSERWGRSCVLPTISSTASQRIKSIRFPSLPHKGPQLFNSLPMNIQGLTNCKSVPGKTVSRFIQSYLCFSASHLSKDFFFNWLSFELLLLKIHQ